LTIEEKPVISNFGNLQPIFYAVVAI